MSTITLSANKINMMPLLIINASNAVKSYKTEMQTLKSKVLAIDSSVCNVEDIISSIKATSQTQEDKIETLGTLNKDMEEFISDVARIDSNAADAINQSNDDFYDDYCYLKPECKKNGWEKFKDGCKKVGEWCKEHWKEILITVAIVIGAVIAIAVVIASGGLALMPLLTGLGLSASAAASISTIVACVAVISTIGSSVLNVIDTWCDIDSPLLKTLQKVFNWASFISNGVYSIGTIYNGFKGISNAAIKEMNANRMVNVSRWGRPGLYSGDWVMKGGNTYWNYLKSGKCQRGLGNQYAPFSSWQTFYVPNGSLKWPIGKSFFDRSLGSIIKWLLGQRRYFP